MVEPTELNVIVMNPDGTLSEVPLSDLVPG